MADKLFYSYNSTWINNNSIKYTEKYTYALVVNPKNHILAYDGKDYGVFHNENYISCIPQSNFVNVSNVVSNTGVIKVYIKIPSNPHTIWTANTGAGSPANASSLVPSDGQYNKLNFDLCINSSIYHISANVNSSTKSKRFWSNCNVLKLSNSNVSNDSVSFGYYRTAGSGNLSGHSYLPFISINGLNPGLGTPVSIYNISFSTQASSGFNTTNYPNLNYVDNAKNTSYMWEIKINPSGAYFVDTTVTNSQMITNSKLPIRTIWGQAFDGTANVQGNLTIASYTHGGTTELGVLKANYVNVNCNDTGNQLAVAGTAVISNTAYLCSGGGNAYIGVSNVTTDAIVNNGTLQAKLYVNGISYVSKLNINSKDTSLNYACRIAGKNTSSTGGSSSQYSIYSTNGWNYLAGNTGIKHVPNTKYKLYIQGDNKDEFGGNSNNYSTYITHGWNFLAGNTGIGQFPDTGIKLWVFGNDTSETGGSTDDYSLYSTNGWNYLASNTGIGVNPSTNYRLHIKGSSSTPTGGDSSHYALYTDYGWNYLASNAGIGITPNTNYKLYVNGRTYLSGNVGIGVAPDTGSTYRLKVDGSSSHLSTLFSNGKIILNDEYTFIQKIHAAGLQPHYDISNGGSNGILNMYISNSETTLWHGNYKNSNLGIHKIFSAQAHIHSNYCGLWNMGIWNYRHYDEYQQDIEQQTKAGTIFSSVYNTTFESRKNSQLGGLNMILFYHTVKNNTAELITNINYVFRSAYRNRILFYGSYTDNNGLWHYQSASGSYSTNGVKGNDGTGTMDSDYFNNNNVMKAYYGDFGGFVSCIEGNVYNIIVLGVVNLYKNKDDYAWHFNNSSLRALSTDTTSLVTSSGLLIYGCWFDSYIGDTTVKNGFSDVVASRYKSIRFRCRVNPDLTWKRYIHVSNTITELHTNWGSTSGSIVGPTAIDNGNKYENHSGVMQNDSTEVHIYMYGPNINDAGSISFRTISITILGWLYDGNN